jgi:uncharacterized glyoxalase superfamily protein PhnB
VDLGRFRVGLRVDDVIRAADFYRGLGFTDVGSVPGSDDVPVMVMLQREGAMLIVDALVGMPFAPSPREAMIQTGPRGLGVAIGLGVDDLEAAYRWCREAGCEITAEPRDEPYGDRVFECIDPFGYVWEISQPISDMPTDEALASTQDSWYGDSSTS